MWKRLKFILVGAAVGFAIVAILIALSIVTGGLVIPAALASGVAVGVILGDATYFGSSTTRECGDTAATKEVPLSQRMNTPGSDVDNKFGSSAQISKLLNHQKPLTKTAKKKSKRCCSVGLWKNFKDSVKNGVSKLANILSYAGSSSPLSVRAIHQQKQRETRATQHRLHHVAGSSSEFSNNQKRHGG